MPKNIPVSIGDTSGSSISVNGSNITLNLAGGACVMYKYTKDSHFTFLNSYGYKVGAYQKCGVKIFTPHYF